MTISNFAVIDILDAGVDDIIDLLHLLAQQFIIAGIPEPIGYLGVDHLDLLDDGMLQLSDLGGDDGVQSGHEGVVVEDGFLLEVFHLRSQLGHCVLGELDVLDELGDVGPVGLAGGIVDETEGLDLEVQYLVQSLDHIVHQLRLLALVHHAILQYYIKPTSDIKLVKDIPKVKTGFIQKMTINKSLFSYFKQILLQNCKLPTFISKETHHQPYTSSYSKGNSNQSNNDQAYWSKAFKTTTYRSLCLVFDALPIDCMPYSIPKEVLHKKVSDRLKIPYLSRSTQSKEEISRVSIYKGVIIKNSNRTFFTIPTAKQDSQEFYYVHYLVNTNYPYTTLTHQALCRPHGKNPDDPCVHFPSVLRTQIGGRVSLWARLSKPDPDGSNRIQNYYVNANFLGRDFFNKFKGFKLEQRFDHLSATQELIK